MQSTSHLLMRVPVNMTSSQILYTTVLLAATAMHSLVLSLRPTLSRMAVTVYLLVRGAAMNILYQVIAPIKATTVELLCINTAVL